MAEHPNVVTFPDDARSLAPLLHHLNNDPFRLTCPFDLQPLGTFLNMAFDEPLWLVDDLLVRGGTSLLVARPKAGKTTLAHTLIRSVARGEPFLGRNCRKGKVILFGLEEHPRFLQQSFRALGLTEEDNVLVHTSSVGADAVDGLRELLRDVPAALVIIDPLLKFVRVQDANEYASVSAALEPVNAIARESGAHLMLLHHTSKAGGADGDSALGSTAISGVVDMILTIRDPGGKRVLTARPRFGDEIQGLALIKDPVTQMITSAQHEPVDTAQLVLRVVAAITGSPDDRLTNAQIRQSLGMGSNATKKALDAAVQGGLVTRTGRGCKGDPYYYSTPDSARKAG